MAVLSRQVQQGNLLRLALLVVFLPQLLASCANQDACFQQRSPRTNATQALHAALHRYHHSLDEARDGASLADLHSILEDVADAHAIANASVAAWTAHNNISRTVMLANELLLDANVELTAAMTAYNNTAELTNTLQSLDSLITGQTAALVRLSDLSQALWQRLCNKTTSTADSQPSTLGAFRGRSYALLELELGERNNDIYLSWYADATGSSSSSSAGLELLLRLEADDGDVQVWLWQRQQILVQWPCTANTAEASASAYQLRDASIMPEGLNLVRLHRNTSHILLVVNGNATVVPRPADCSAAKAWRGTIHVGGTHSTDLGHAHVPWPDLGIDADEPVEGWFGCLAHLTLDGAQIHRASFTEAVAVTDCQPVKDHNITCDLGRRTSLAAHIHDRHATEQQHLDSLQVYANQLDQLAASAATQTSTTAELHAALAVFPAEQTQLTRAIANASTLVRDLQAVASTLHDRVSLLVARVSNHTERVGFAHALARALTQTALNHSQTATAMSDEALTLHAELASLQQALQTQQGQVLGLNQRQLIVHSVATGLNASQHELVARLGALMVTESARVLVAHQEILEQVITVDASTFFTRAEAAAQQLHAAVATLAAINGSVSALAQDAQIVRDLANKTLSRARSTTHEAATLASRLSALDQTANFSRHELALKTTLVPALSDTVDALSQQTATLLDNEAVQNTTRHVLGEQVRATERSLAADHTHTSAMLAQVLSNANACAGRSDTAWTALQEALTEALATQHSAQMLSTRLLALASQLHAALTASRASSLADQLSDCLKQQTELEAAEASLEVATASIEQQLTRATDAGCFPDTAQ